MVSSLVLRVAAPDLEKRLASRQQARKPVLVILLFFIGVAVAAGQIQPPALDVATMVSNAYARVSQYQLEIQSVSNNRSNETEFTVLRIAAKNQKYRVETEISTGSIVAPKTSALIVFDGSTTWTYNPQLRTYSTLSGSAFGSGGLWISEFLDIPGEFRRKGGISMTLLKDERIEIAPGDERDCAVLEVKYPQTTDTLWVEKRTNHVLRVRGSGTTSTFTKIDLNPRLPDDLFEFKPPVGARKAE